MRVHLGNIVVKLIFCLTEHAAWVNEHAYTHIKSQLLPSVLPRPIQPIHATRKDTHISYTQMFKYDCSDSSSSFRPTFYRPMCVLYTNKSESNRQSEENKDKKEKKKENLFVYSSMKPRDGNKFLTISHIFYFICI